MVKIKNNSIESRSSMSNLKYSTYKRYGVDKEIIESTRKDCCMSFARDKGGINLEIFVFTHQLLRPHMDSYEYMKAVEDYIASLGLNATLTSKKAMYSDINHPLYVRANPNEEDGDVNKCWIFHIDTKNYKKGSLTLGTHSLIRALWSDRFDGLWDRVFELRGLKELKDLDNYEIWQLAEYEKKYWGYHGIMPTEGDSDGRLHYIISLDGLRNRFKNEKLTRVHATFAQKMDLDTEATKSMRDKVRNMFKAKKYLELYKMQSLKGKASFGECIDDEDKEDWVLAGKSYDVKEVKNKRLILVNCEDGIQRRLNKKRFKLSE